MISYNSTGVFNMIIDKKRVFPINGSAADHVKPIRVWNFKNSIYFNNNHFCANIKKLKKESHKSK